MVWSHFGVTGVNTVSALHAFGTQGLQTVDGIRAVQRRALISRGTCACRSFKGHTPPQLPSTLLTTTAAAAAAAAAATIMGSH